MGQFDNAVAAGQDHAVVDHFTAHHAAGNHRPFGRHEAPLLINSALPANDLPASPQPRQQRVVPVQLHRLGLARTGHESGFDTQHLLTVGDQYGSNAYLTPMNLDLLRDQCFFPGSGIRDKQASMAILAELAIFRAAQPPPHGACVQRRNVQRNRLQEITTGNDCHTRCQFHALKHHTQQSRRRASDT
ncbi:hypothetical protein ALP75_200237 [Pseudomonas syringae pv. actinidiae]|nr:hypothetical protein ALP75_200237 [Pseudomonas syringae pv. actinidiae]